MSKLPPVRRARDGRYVPTLCPDPNCNGVLQLEITRHPVFGVDAEWRCDGLTYEKDDDDLEACARVVDAPLSEAP